MSEHADRLAERIARQEAVVAVLGMGYVGLPLALAFAERGFLVLGFDTDAAKVEALKGGRSYIGHLAAERVAAARAAGRLAATADAARLAEADALLICVPTPLAAGREPDLSHIEATAETIARTLRPGQLVVLESTTYPGTTNEVLRPRLEASGLVAGRDFFLAYSPEREDPGSKEHAITSIPKLVGGVDPLSGDLAQRLYDQVVARTVRVADAETAEAAKLTENVFRAVNIALVNELKVVYECLGIDVWEVLAAAKTKPFGFMPFEPGPGWGGHCIPIDPFYLSWRAAQHGTTARFIELAGAVNVEMPRHVVARLRATIDGSLAGRRVLVLGLAYKRDVADPRESPAFEVLSLLLDEGAEVAYHDPHIPEAPAMRTWRDLPRLTSVPLTAAALATYDAVVLVTDHSAVDYDLVRAHSRAIVDTRGVYPRGTPN
ncbi:MAG: nucleotide sugar dehydrogenase, partial [Thermoanaerobaculia bacterium]